jgi:hypothetical protein
MAVPPHHPPAFVIRSAALAAIAAILSSLSLGTSAAAKNPPDFRFDVRPILAKNCFACHGPDENKREADLRLDMRDAAVETGAIVPGTPGDSELVRRITSDDPEERMPPAETGHVLSPAEVSTLKDWIAAGAPYAPHWSYTEPKRPELPQVSHAEWCRNPIDYYVMAQLDKAGLRPEPEADRYRLIRRLSLDLTGLPPTIAEADEFARDNRPDAYERVVDRLLASSAYGEHWARKWLDLARYADTNGYEKDGSRTIWPFRDWVINSLNADMPFDQFTIEQLAGDLLDEPTKDQIIATAFHRNTMQNDEGGTDDEEFRTAAVVDRVNTTMQVWMATTIGCCQCHSHKYDPFSQREYYQIYAFFNQTADADRVDSAPVLGTWLKKPAPKRKKGGPTGQDAMPIMQELPADRQRTTRVLIRGSFLNPGETVTAATPEALPTLPGDLPKNRLGFAKWLVSRSNPLTSRVTANRAWEQFFGRGIVLTSEDFGSQGMLPTHPDLLDWLGVELMDGKWSLKHLAKTIVMSAAYRQSSQTSAEKLLKDPDNQLMSRGPRERLSAEQIRDQALAVSNLLSRKMGGPSVMPPQPEGMWQMVYSDEKWITSAGEDRYRRGLYTFWRRTSPYPTSMALDATSHETCTIRRVTTNTPIAAFALLNDPVYVEAAQALARSVLKNGGVDTNARATYAFRQVLVRPPTAEEIARLVSLFELEQAHYAADADAARKMTTVEPIDPKSPAPDSPNLAELAAWTVVSNVLLNLDETLNK